MKTPRSKKEQKELEGSVSTPKVKQPKKASNVTPDKVIAVSLKPSDTYQPGQLSLKAKKAFIDGLMSTGHTGPDALDLWEQRRIELISSMSDAEQRRRRFKPSLKAINNSN